MYQADKKSLIKNEKGMTLIEVLVVIFISSFVIGSLFNMMGWNIKLAFNSFSNQQEVEQYRIFTATIANELKFSKHIEIINDGDTDKLSYVRANNSIVVYHFKEDGLYKVINDEEFLIAKGKAYESNSPKVYVIGEGFIRFNFYAEEINSLLFLTIKPKTYDFI